MDGMKNMTTNTGLVNISEEITDPEIRRFAELIEINMPQYLGGGMSEEIESITICPAKKVNQPDLIAMSIKTKGSDISPQLYLNDFHDSVLNKTMSYDEVLCRLRDMLLNARFSGKSEDLMWMTKFEEVKTRLIPRLVNAEINKDLLKTHPHRMFDDLAMVFSVVVSVDPAGDMATSMVTNEMMESWDVNEDILEVNATDNTDAVVRSISDVLREMTGIPDDFDIGMPDLPIAVITNSCRVNAAAMVFDKDLEFKIDEALQGCGDETGYYLLPSSVHEMLAVPKALEENIDALKALVMCVNADPGVISKSDYLSDNVYEMSSDGRLELARDPGNTTEQEHSHRRVPVDMSMRLAM